MADEQPPPAPEPQPEPPPVVDENAQLRAELDAERQERMRLQSMLQPDPQPSYIEGVAAVRASSDPRDRLILGLGEALADVNDRLRATEARQDAGDQIPPDRLAAAKAEFARGGYKSMLDADAAAVGKAVIAGKLQNRPKPIAVQTAVRSVTPAPGLDDIKEMAASEFKQQLKGPNAVEIHRRYKAGQFTVVPG